MNEKRELQTSENNVDIEALDRLKLAAWNLLAGENPGISQHYLALAQNSLAHALQSDSTLIPETPQEIKAETEELPQEPAQFHFKIPDSVPGLVIKTDADSNTQIQTGTPTTPEEGLVHHHVNFVAYEYILPSGEVQIGEAVAVDGQIVLDEIAAKVYESLVRRGAFSKESAVNFQSIANDVFYKTTAHYRKFGGGRFTLESFNLNSLLNKINSLLGQEIEYTAQTVEEGGGARQAVFLKYYEPSTISFHNFSPYRPVVQNPPGSRLPPRPFEQNLKMRDSKAPVMTQAVSTVSPMQLRPPSPYATPKSSKIQSPAPESEKKTTIPQINTDDLIPLLAVLLVDTENSLRLSQNPKLLALVREGYEELSERFVEGKDAQGDNRPRTEIFGQGALSAWSSFSALISQLHEDKLKLKDIEEVYGRDLRYNTLKLFLSYTNMDPQDLQGAMEMVEASIKGAYNLRLREAV